MSLLNLSRISTLTSLRRFPVMTKCIPVFTRTIVSTRPLLNCKIDSALKVEKLSLAKISLMILPDPIGRIIFNKSTLQKLMKIVFPFLLARSEEIHKLMLTELNPNQMVIK